MCDRQDITVQVTAEGPLTFAKTTLNSGCIKFEPNIYYLVGYYVFGKNQYCVCQYSICAIYSINEETIQLYLHIL